MTRRSIGLLLPPLLMFTCAALYGPAVSGHGVSAATPAMTANLDSSANSGAAIQQKGRYKKDGDNCVWDANDSGPNQCTPRIKGRFKKGANDACTWDTNDLGPDQCRPPKGRWKKNADRCTWDAKDDGPDQCNPRQAR